MALLKDKPACRRRRRAKRAALVGCAMTLLLGLTVVIASPATANSNNFTVRISPQHAPGVCLSLETSVDWDGQAGVPVIQWDCNGKNGQQWEFEHRSGNTYRIRNKVGQQCLGIAGSTDVPWVWQWTKCNGKASQEWILDVIKTVDGADMVQIESAGKPDMCWDVKGFNTTGSTSDPNARGRVQIYSCKEGTAYESRNQIFYLTTNPNGGGWDTWDDAPVCTQGRSATNDGGACQSYIMPFAQGIDWKIYGHRIELGAAVKRDYDMQPDWGFWNNRYPLLAVADGTAEFVCGTGVYHAKVKLTTNSGDVFTYLHLDTPSVEAIFGSADKLQVTQGQVLGYMSTVVGDPVQTYDDEGVRCHQYSTGPHLHFETPDKDIKVGDWTYYPYARTGPDANYPQCNLGSNICRASSDATAHSDTVDCDSICYDGRKSQLEGGSVVLEGDPNSDYDLFEVRNGTLYESCFAPSGNEPVLPWRHAFELEWPIKYQCDGQPIPT